jgi:hypothetical protein
MTKKLIEQVPCEIIIFINQNMVNYNMHNYVEDEINCLNIIIKEYFKEAKEQCQKSIVDKFYKQLKNENLLDAIDLWDLIIEQKINLNIKEINSFKNDKNYKIIDGILLYSIINDINVEDIQELYKHDRDFIKEIQDTNDVNGHFKGNGYIANNKLDKLIHVLVELKKLDSLLKKEPKYFKPYQEPIKKDENEKKEENKDENKNDENKEEKDKKDDEKSDL